MCPASLCPGCIFLVGNIPFFKSLLIPEDVAPLPDGFILPEKIAELHPVTSDPKPHHVRPAANTVTFEMEFYGVVHVHILVHSSLWRLF